MLKGVLAFPTPWCNTDSPRHASPLLGKVSRWLRGGGRRPLRFKSTFLFVWDPISTMGAMVVLVWEVLALLKCCWRPYWHAQVQRLLSRAVKGESLWLISSTGPSPPGQGHQPHIDGLECGLTTSQCFRLSSYSVWEVFPLSLLNSRSLDPVTIKKSRARGWNLGVPCLDVRS